MMEALIERWRQSAPGRWFEALEARDRIIVIAIAGASLAAILFLSVWQPLHSWAQREGARYERQVALLDWMRANETAARNAARTASTARAGGDGGSLLTLVANSAGAAGIQLTRYQPEAGGGVSVVLQGQDFNAILGWLASMERQQQVRVRQMSIDAQGEPGRVNARINLI